MDCASLPPAVKLNILNLLQEKGSFDESLLRSNEQYFPPPQLFGDLTDSPELSDLFDSKSALTLTDLRALSRDGFLVKDGVFGEEKALRIHASMVNFASSGSLKKAAMLHQSQSGRKNWEAHSLRGDNICWIRQTDDSVPSEIREVWQFFDGFRERLNSATEFNSQKMQLQCAHYPGGGARYVRHVDAPPPTDGKAAPSARRLTLLYYANPTWRAADGGQLRVFVPTPNGEKQRDIPPKGDRLVAFWSSWLPHEVLPSSSDRYSLTAWMY
eukprot:2169_1